MSRLLQCNWQPIDVIMSALLVRRFGGTGDLGMLAKRMHGAANCMGIARKGRLHNRRVLMTSWNLRDEADQKECLD
jgi:hypothetical protein